MGEFFVPVVEGEKKHKGNEEAWVRVSLNWNEGEARGMKGNNRK